MTRRDKPALTCATCGVPAGVEDDEVCYSVEQDQWVCFGCFEGEGVPAEDQEAAREAALG